MNRLILSLSLLLTFSLSAAEEKEPSLVYQEQQLRGWTVRVNERLLPEGDLYEGLGVKAHALLEASLIRIALLVPERQLLDLQKVTIVLDEHPKLRAAQYHPSVGWLEENGYDPQLGKCVHISKASFFIEERHVFQQPSVVLHELAHAYHDQVLGWDFPPIVEAFAKAQEKGDYEEVLHISGKKVRHYALTDHKEYFAEATEAWFGMNDFFPFVRPELKAHDGTLYEVVGKIWEAKAGN
ncbi:metallopeptidase [Roseibacillus persicicus]|uniref:Metallopeptidase n=1 Tax=Roseibacillus persicicus TaxID=454148 RepID=A0A918TLZ2_9BACT|nr:metallopeptidase [Roseibacillus persicicus]GHC50873.1 metallopeptidase [Roseibacillus persicicus]